MVGKILLRLALSQTVDNKVAPADWQLSSDSFGKPKLTQSSLPLRFSISHNETVTVVAVGCGIDVGVDVESADQVIVPAVVRDFLTAREYSILRESNPKAQAQAAIRLWTLKEAYGKMLGVGLGLEFSAIDLGLGGCPELSKSCSATLQDWTLTLANSVRCQIALALGAKLAASETNIFTIGSQGHELLF